jgi:hypothetical protein
MMFRAVFWVILPCKITDDGRQYAPLKRRSTIILHGSITQKTALNIRHNLGNTVRIDVPTDLN